MKLIAGKYKTYEGARKRAAFENGVAPSEYNKGYRAHLYRYTVVPQDDGVYRVGRERAKVAAREPIGAIMPDA